MELEGSDTGSLSEIEKKGLYQVAEILENYGIDSETDVSLIDQDCASTCREHVAFVVKYPSRSSTTLHNPRRRVTLSSSEYEFVDNQSNRQGSLS